MEFHHYPETDSLYVEFKPGPGAETVEITDGLNADLDAGGQVVGLDIDHAWKGLDLTLRLKQTACPDGPPGAG